MARIGVGDNERQGPRPEGLLDGPQQAGGPVQGEGHETPARQPQGFEAMAIDPAVFAFFPREPAPQQGTLLGGIGQAAQGQSQGEAHGGWQIAMVAGGHIVKARPRQTMGGEMGVDGRNAQGPRSAPHRAAAELRQTLFDPRDMMAQNLDQTCRFVSWGYSGDAKRLRPLSPCRFPTHHWNVLNVLFLFSHMRKQESR